MNAQHDETPGPLGCASADAPLWSRLAGRICRFGLTPVLAAALACGATFARAEAPKRGGVLTYMIPADGGPSLDGHRETTYAVVHATAPFYSVLIRVNPDNPSSTTDFRCDLCTEMPKPTDNGLTYTFKIRKGVKFHDGSPLTAQDVAASWNKIVHPPEGCRQRAREQLRDGGHHHGAGRRDGGVQAEIRDPDVPAGAGRSLRLHLFEEEARPGHALVREEHHGVRPIQADRIPDRPVHQGRAQPRLLSPGPALPRRLRGDLRAQAGGAHGRHPRRPRRPGIPVDCRLRRATSW